MKYIICSALLVSMAAGAGYVSTDQPLMLSATETVTEYQSGLPFLARVDTGAHSCSIHCEEIKIENAANEPRQNIGKPIRFLVKNRRGQSKWVEATIADYVTVRTSEDITGRYKVLMSIGCQNVRKEVLVTLNNREHMKYGLLLGRNFLQKDFIVAID